MNAGLTSHKQRHTETRPRFKVSSEKSEKWGIELAIPGLVVQCVIHYTTATAGSPLRKESLPFSYLPSFSTGVSSYVA